MLHRLCERREFASRGRGEALDPQDRVVCTEWDDGLRSGVARCGRCGSCWLLTWVRYEEKTAPRPRYVVEPIDAGTFAALWAPLPEGERRKTVSYGRVSGGLWADADRAIERSCEAMTGEMLVTVDDGWQAIYRVRAPWSRGPGHRT